MELLEDNLGENLDDLVFGDDMLDITSKARFMKEMTGRLDFIKFKKLMLCEGHYQENEKTSHRLRKITCKRYVWLKTIIQSTQRIPKTQQ